MLARSLVTYDIFSAKILSFCNFKLFYTHFLQLIFFTCMFLPFFFNYLVFYVEFQDCRLDAAIFVYEVYNYNPYQQQIILKEGATLHASSI
jgi:hypothetical protein